MNSVCFILRHLVRRGHSQDNSFTLARLKAVIYHCGLSSLAVCPAVQRALCRSVWTNLHSLKEESLAQ